MASTTGRRVVLPLTNKSGGGVIAGDVVIIDTANNDSFTTTTTGSYTGMVGVAQETIASNATGRVLVSGYASLVNVNASVTRGNFGLTHTVAKQATDGGSSRVTGGFCQFLTGGTTPTAHLFAIPDGSSASGSVATDAIWDAAGDVVVGTGANTAARVAIGANRKVLKSNGTTAAWAFPTFIGAQAYNSTGQSLNDVVIPLDSEEYDTDAFHSTVTNTSRMTIPSGLDGTYLINAASYVNGASRLQIQKNGTTLLRGRGQTLAAVGYATCTVIAVLAATDYVEILPAAGVSRTYGDAGSPADMTSLTIVFLGV